MLNVTATQDPRGLTVPAIDHTAAAAFETALRQFQSYRGDPVATIDAALEAHPEFIAGHILRAEVLITMWERSFLPDIRGTMTTLQALAPRATEREHAHIAAIGDWVAGDWRGMQARLDRILDDYPTDALALQVGHLADFYHGDRDNLRGRVARVLPHWNRDMPGYGFLLGMLAFGFEECGDYGRAEDTGRRAVELEPDDCWAHHAVTHVMEMQGRQAEGIAWMESRRDRWAQDDNGFAFHNWWHTALYNLDLGRVGPVLDIYDGAVRPSSTKIQLQMLDAAALLWRLHLQRIDVGDRWTELAGAYEEAAEDGFYAFNDMHAMMAFAATGRRNTAERLLRAVEDAAQGTGTNAAMTAQVGLPIVRALEAFGCERYGETVERLLPVRYRAHAFGGSHAQRDVVHRTLIEAALRAGQHSLAHALTIERTTLKPHCPFSWQLRRRAAAGLPDLQRRWSTEEAVA